MGSRIWYFLVSFFIGLGLFLSTFTFSQNTSKTQTKKKKLIDHGQRWQALWNAGRSFSEVRDAFYEDYGDVPIQQIPRYKQFKRLENLYLPRIDADGDYHPKKTIDNFRTFKKSKGSSNKSGTANWSFVGPNTVPSFINFQEGIGRVDRVSFHPSNATTFWVSTPTQGLWKTTDNGANWSALTDDWTGLGVGDVIVNPTNTNIIYVSTGTGDAGSISPFGIMKSTDGGTSYNSSGLTTVNQIHKLVMDPSNSSRLFAATNEGLYVTTDGAASWSLHGSLPSGVVYDIEFNPTNDSTIYLTINNGGSVEFRKSTDAGTTFSSITMPYVPTGISRTLIAVTPHDPNYVYVFTADVNTAGMEGLYRSTDNGTSFAKISSPTDAVSYPNGDPHSAPTLQAVISNNSAWGWILGVSPTNKDDIYIGAVWICRSTDGGSTWKDIGDSNHGGIGVHVDYHDIKWHPTTGLLYLATDGGIYRDNGSWPIANISEGLGIQQNYTLSSTKTGVKLLTGNQDNGTFYYNGSSWAHWLSGDGMTCLFDPGNENTFYGSFQNGLAIVKTTNGGTTVNNMITTTSTGQVAGWEVQFKIDPFFRDHLYCAYQDVWKSVDGGNTWNNLSNGALTGGGSLTILEISKADPNFIITGNAVTGKYFKTTDGGTTWSQITTLTGFVLDILLHPSNSNILWAVNSAQGEVAKSTDGGTTWTDISGSLPANVTNTIVYQEDSPDDALYVGQDIAVYYLDNNLSDWVLYNAGLPNVIIRELEILPCTGKIRAGTYGRGVWESDLYSHNQATACCPPDIPSITSVTCNTSATLTASAAPTGYTYRWYKDKVLMPAETLQVLNTNSSGDYFVLFHNGTCNSYHSDPVKVDLSLPSIASSAMTGDVLDMDGINDHLTIPHSSSIQLGNDFTIEFWAKSSSTFTGTKFLMRKEFAYGLDLLNGTDIRFVTWGDDILLSNAFLNDGNWHHYAFTASGGNEKKFYRDGNLISTNNNSYNTDQGSTILYLGFWNAPAAVTFDEVRIWNNTRTSSEIQNNAFCSIDCRTTDLVLYLPFEGGVANGDNTGISIVKDYSSYANHATLVNLTLNGGTSNFISSSKIGAVMGPDVSCSNINDSYQIVDIPNATGYTWTLPNGWSGSSSTHSITPIAGTNSGNIEVTASLSCGNATFSKSVQALGLCEAALHFDGTDDFVNCGNGISLANSSFTIEFWGRLYAAPGGVDFFISGGTQIVNHGLNIGFTSGSFFTLGFWGDDLNVSTSYTDNKWHHWACVFDANTNEQRIYRDGVLLGSRTTTNGNYLGGGNLHLGRSTWGARANVAMDELRIFNVARSQVEIQNNMSFKIDPNTSGLIAYYNFEDGMPEANNIGTTTIVDITNNNNDGNLSGFALVDTTSNFIYAKNGVNTAAPTADFSANQTNVSLGSAVVFSDQSANVPTTWSWGFPGGTPSVSSLENPTVTYNTVGTYDVTLIVTNAAGSDTITKTSFITVNDDQTYLESPFRKIYTSYGELIACRPVTNAQQYQMEFTPTGGGSVVTYTTIGTGHSFLLSAVTGLVDNTTYDVRARAKLNGNFGNYGQTYQMTTPSSVLTSIMIGCGKTYSAYHELLACYPVVNAEQYEFEFTPSGGGTAITFATPGTGHSILLNWVNGLVDNTLYDVRVRVKLNGSFGPYGSICQFTTPSSVLTSIMVGCGKTYSAYHELLACYPVVNAEQYEFEFTPAGGGATVTYVTANSGHSILLSYVSGLVDNTLYDVRVRVKLSGSFGAYGNTCQITTPSSVLTSLMIGCGRNYNSYNSLLACFPVTGAEQYEFEFTPSGGGSIVTFETPGTGHSILLSWVTGLVDNTLYDTRVRVKLSGTYGSYGPSCSIRTPAMGAGLRMARENDEDEHNRQVLAMEEATMIVYPNPSFGEFIYAELKGIPKKSTITVTDISGQVKFYKELNNETKNMVTTLRFDTKLPSGFYLVTLNSGKQKMTKKLVVTER